MSRSSDHEFTYQVIEKWKENCLLNDKGLIWENESIWTAENFSRFRKIFIERPDETGNTFDEKLKKQLAGEEESVHKFVIEILFIYYVFPYRTKYETKLNKLEMVAAWKDITIDRSLPIFDALKVGLASTGAFYNAGKYYEISLLYLFVENIKGRTVEERTRIMDDPMKLKGVIELVRETVGKKVQMQHMIQHLLLPDHFERIASWGNKEQVASAFSYLLEDSPVEDIDEQIHLIREKLGEEYPDDKIDFYANPVIEQKWRPKQATKSYFWITANPSIWLIEDLLAGGAVEYPLLNESGHKRKHTDVFNKAKAGDLVIFYQPGASRKVIGRGKMEQGIYKNDQSEEVVSFSLIEALDPISWNDLTKHPDFKKSAVVDRDNRGSLFELTKKEYEVIVNWKYVTIEDGKIPIPSVSFDIDPGPIDLVFENEDILMEQIMTAIRSGKHIILTGPPGTGKSKLATSICEMYGTQSTMVTAASNWSTYETIGGYRPDQEGHLYFDAGIFLQCVKDKQTNEPINKWLIIDEINRADIDKAFGSLFSVLTGDEVSLPFQAKSGESIRMMPQGEVSAVEPDDFTYIIPDDWRIIGTMNTIDKASLYELSYAFMRRFAFIPVGIPKALTESLVKEYLAVWGLRSYPNVKELTKIWNIINDYRKIGPAIVQDLAQYTAVNDDFSSAIILYVLPQFEGLSTNQIKGFVYRLIEETDTITDRSMLDDFIDDFFYLGEL